jgi:hypothetical protein
MSILKKLIIDLGLYSRMDYMDTMNPIDTDTISIDSSTTALVAIIVLYQVLTCIYILCIRQ